MKNLTDMLGEFTKKGRQRRIERIRAEQSEIAEQLVHTLGSKVKSMLDKVKPTGRDILRAAFRADPSMMDEMVDEIDRLIKHDYDIRKYKLPTGLRRYIAEKIIYEIVAK